jgi:hypothetical protein
LRSKASVGSLCPHSGALARLPGAHLDVRYRHHRRVDHRGNIDLGARQKPRGGGDVGAHAAHSVGERGHAGPGRHDVVDQQQPVALQIRVDDNAVGAAGRINGGPGVGVSVVSQAGFDGAISACWVVSGPKVLAADAGNASGLWTARGVEV